MRSRYGRSPALDGIRGVFMLIFVLGHIGVAALTGSWIAINLFFVLSGFLITRLLVEEHERFGRISAVGFYVRRARRLLPGLFVVLGCITAYLWLLAPEGMRGRWGGDVLATLGFVINWRLIGQGDEYFGDQALPSPLRHAWTLSIEEQYYVLVPFLVMALFAVLRSRRARTIALLALAALATVWAAHVATANADNYPRVYYGTDTRVSALVFGSAVGVAFGWTRRDGIPRLPGRWLEAIGWGAMVPVLVAILRVGPYSQWMYTSGGALLFTILITGPILVCADRRPTTMSRLFALPPCRWLGRVSYALYLWHWPVHLLVGHDTVLGSPALTGAVAVALSGVLAHLSTEYLERPVLRDGVRAILPRLRWRPLAVVVPVLVVATASVSLGAVSRTNEQIAEHPTSLDAAPPIVQDQPEYVPGRPRRIAVIGDSVPWYLVHRFPTGIFPGVELVDLTHKGCDVLTMPMDTAFGARNQASMCQQAWDAWPTRLKETRPDAVLVFAGPLMAATYQLPDGTTTAIGQPGFDAILHRRLDELLGWARAGGVRQVQIVGQTCRDFGVAADSDEYRRVTAKSPQYIPEFERPTRINAALRSWVAAHPGETAYVDLAGALCPTRFREKVNGITLFNDKLHYSPEATPMIWRYVLGQVSHNFAGR